MMCEDGKWRAGVPARSASFMRLFVESLLTSCFGNRPVGRERRQ